MSDSSNGSSANEIRPHLQEIFRNVFGDDEITLRDEMTAADVDGWDSMMTINLMIAIEKHFKIKFAAAELANIKADGQNIGTLIALIDRKRGGGGGGGGGGRA